MGRMFWPISALVLVGMLIFLALSDPKDYFKDDSKDINDQVKVVREIRKDRVVVIEDPETGYQYFASRTSNGYFVIGGVVLDKDGKPKKGDK